MTQEKTFVDYEEQQAKIKDLIAFSGGDPNTFECDLISQMVQVGLKLIHEGCDLGQLKLMTRALKEMRYAYRIFNRYLGGKKISIFGSARTPPDHPDYLAAKALGAALTTHGWACITGAADGIMKAGLEGAERDSSFGLSIRLPFESTANSLIAGDPKLITFRYFFTRKLMFLSHSDAVAAFPGGFGTQDELYEVLTLMQTGKANIIPLVLIEGPQGDYWHHWNNYLEKHLLGKGWISPEDKHFFYIAPSVDSAVQHILHFYNRYHSSRYVGDILVIRLSQPISVDKIARLNEEFSSLVRTGEIYTTEPLSEETDHLDLPRIAFEHTRRKFGLLRALIDRINED